MAGGGLKHLIGFYYSGGGPDRFNIDTFFLFAFGWLVEVGGLVG